MVSRERLGWRSRLESPAGAQTARLAAAETNQTARQDAVRWVCTGRNVYLCRLQYISCEGASWGENLDAGQGSEPAGESLAAREVDLGGDGPRDGTFEEVRGLVPSWVGNAEGEAAGHAGDCSGGEFACRLQS